MYYGRFHSHENHSNASRRVNLIMLFTGGGWLSSPSVRIAFSGYKDRRSGEWAVDTKRWNNILDLAKKGTEVTGAVIDQVEKGVAIYRGR